MRNSERTYLPSLDGLRAVSIAIVILAHAFAYTAPPALRPLAAWFDGPLGVRIFFVISGFLITTLLLGEQRSGGISLPRFYLRRALRLAPVQLAYIAALFLLTRTTALQVSTCQFVTALTYTKNYACSGLVDGHLWSLSVEEQFYLLWPALLAFLPRRWLLPALALLAVLGPISRVIEYGQGARSFVWLTSNIDMLMIGCLAAWWMSQGSARLAKALAWRPALMRGAAVLAIATPEVLSAHLWLAPLTVSLGPTLQALAAAYLICSLIEVRRGWSYVALNTAPVRFLGRMSYSLYVWQQLFFVTAVTFGVSQVPWLSFPLNIAFALLAGLASYLVIETPVAGLRARFRARPEPGPVLAPQAP